jgi:hypothetical protein
MELLKSEIESCGWDYFENPEGRTLNDNYYKRTLSLRNDIKLEFRLRKIGENITIWSDDTDSVYFNGTVKNPEELMVLMRQINCL